MNEIDRRILKIIACPICKEKVELKGEEFICVKCNISYPIENGMPIMLASRAKRRDNEKDSSDNGN